MDAYKSTKALLVSAADTVARTSDAQESEHERGVMLFLDITANPGGVETLTPQIQAKDPVSGNWRNITTFPVATAATNSTFIFILYPAAAETVATAQLEVQSIPLPRNWRVVVTPSASGSFTYSVGYSTLI